MFSIIIYISLYFQAVLRKVEWSRGFRKGSELRYIPIVPLNRTRHNGQKLKTTIFILMSSWSPAVGSLKKAAEAVTSHGILGTPKLQKT